MHMRTYVRMVVCVYLPRLELVVAARGAGPLAGRPVAVAPLPGCEQRLGEVSGAAEARGVTRGMALGERWRRALVLDGSDARRWLARRPIARLGFRPETEALLEPFERLGMRTLGELAKLPRDALADRFGQAGVSAHRLACGEDDPPRGREAIERLCETQDVGESGSGPALERVLG